MMMMKVTQRMMMFESRAHRQGVQSITEITSSLPLARTSHCGACMCCIRVIIINLNIMEEKLFFEVISCKIRLKTLSHCHRPPTVGLHALHTGYHHQLGYQGGKTIRPVGFIQNLTRKKIILFWTSHGRVCMCMCFLS